MSQINLSDFKTIRDCFQRLLVTVSDSSFSKESLQNNRLDLLHFLKISIRLSEQVSTRLYLRFKLVHARALLNSHQDHYKDAYDLAYDLVEIVENKTN